MAKHTTEIRLDEYGSETHESWVLVRANNVSSSPPGARLFDSEITHQHSIVVEVARCTRKRDLHRDYLHDTEVLMQLAMSQAQWGAFVSSFGNGNGVPATLEYLVGVGDVPGAPDESRLAESHAEVLNAGKDALSDVDAQFQKVMEAFETGGKAALRQELRSLGFALRNAPLNMEFAARSLTEHAENVVTKARRDIEGMALAAYEQGALAPASPLQLGPTKPDDDPLG